MVNEMVGTVGAPLESLTFSWIWGSCMHCDFEFDEISHDVYIYIYGVRRNAHGGGCNSVVSKITDGHDNKRRLNITPLMVYY